MPLHLSIVIPAYNEAGRLPPYLARIRDYCDLNLIDDYEVVVVDDGSVDETATVVERLAASWPELRLERQRSNLGKGAAVRHGVLAARGEIVLFADADGATPIAEERKLRAAIAAGAAVAVGSRSDADCRRSWHRKLIGGGFAFLVRGLLGIPVRDTQCGFKMFRREAARALFGPCPEPGYLFDLHILALAARMGIPLAEVPISWRDVPGSKLRLASDSWRMLLGLLRLRAKLARVPAARTDPSAATQPADWGSYPWPSQPTTPGVS